jgi:hypothetical protein
VIEVEPRSEPEICCVEYQIDSERDSTELFTSSPSTSTNMLFFGHVKHLSTLLNVCAIRSAAGFLLLFCSHDKHLMGVSKLSQTFAEETLSVSFDFGDGEGGLYGNWVNLVRQGGS